MASQRYVIEEEGSEWFPSPFKWYWRRSDNSESTLENPMGRHGAYPARWIAELQARRATR